MTVDEQIKLAIYTCLLQHGGRVTPNHPGEGLIEIAETIYQWVKRNG